jgi:hypothetical protein
MLDKRCNINVQRHLSLESVKKTVILPRIEPQSLNPGEYLGEQILVYRKSNHLKRDISTVSDDLRSDLDELDGETAK